MNIYDYRGRISIEAYFERCEVFHGFLAPGVVLGGLIVDYILDEMGLSHEFDAVVETRKCLPDAVQLLTPCSVGNGWMRVMDWGKLAITLYDYQTRDAMRVALDYDKLDRYPLVRAWALKTLPKKENPLEPLVDEMLQGRRDMFSRWSGSVGTLAAPGPPYGQPRVCTRCGEVFRNGTGTVCQGCLEPFFTEQ